MGKSATRAPVGITCWPPAPRGRSQLTHTPGIHRHLQHATARRPMAFASSSVTSHLVGVVGAPPRGGAVVAGHQRASAEAPQIGRRLEANRRGKLAPTVRVHIGLGRTRLRRHAGLARGGEQRRARGPVGN